MSTLSDIRHDPESYLGPGVTAEDLLLFAAAVEIVQQRDSRVTEDEAVDIVWGNGNWTRNAERILAAG